MWIIVGTVLLLYLLGLLFICFLNTGRRRNRIDGEAENPSNVDNISESASSRPGLRGFYQRHQHRLLSPHHHRQLLQRYYQRLFFTRLVSSNFRYEEESRYTTTVSPSPDLSRSSLFAYREQQLRQIHHEINEMSYLLGTHQTQSDDRARSVPVPIYRETMVQPLSSSGGSGASAYSFVHQLASPSPSTVTTGVSVSTRRDSAIGSSPSASSCAGSCTVNPTHQSIENTPGGNVNVSENCHILRERQRRLRRIRMELEGLSLQLNSDDRYAGGNMAPMLLLQQNARHSSMLLNISGTPSAGTTNFPPLIYFSGGGGNEVTTTHLINDGTTWSINNDNEDDLPGYESIVCLLNSSEEQMEDTPPPSYNEALHLYSFSELEERKK